MNAGTLHLKGSIRILSRRGAYERPTTKNHRFQSQSSNAWKRRHEKDPYVKRARKEGSPSRAIYKIEEIEKSITNLFQKKKRLHSLGIRGLFRPGDTVLDLGAAPGSWSLYASKKIGPEGLLVAVDLLDLNTKTMAKLNNNKAPFHAIKGDFTSKAVQQSIVQILASRVDESLKIDCIISDMAANFTGDQLTDALRTMNLCEDAMMFAAGPSCFEDKPGYDQSLLRPGGVFLCKFFACGQNYEEDLMNAASRSFEYTSVIKPSASRKKSAEMYLFACGFKSAEQK